MKKVISIIIAAIIIFTANISAEAVYASTNRTNQITMSAKSSPHTNKKKKKHKHVMPKGNMKKWFKSKKAMKKYVSSVMEKYNSQYENGEITWDEYVKRCPYGYEAWSCYCGKWTGNFKYHKG